MSLMAHYEKEIAQGKIHSDSQQKEVILILQDIADKLKQSNRLWFRSRKKTFQKGLYLFGPVGAGKTYLMDLFYQYIPERRKKRIHFHEFMQQVDAQLRQLQGNLDPLKQIAKQLAKTTHVLCLDEFLVQDVGTAMILVELFKQLFANHMILIMTSNTPPDDLYLYGLQRARFLSVIALIKQNCHVVDLLHAKDYRLGRIPLAKAYLFPLNQESQVCMLEQFHQITTGRISTEPLLIQGRLIPVIKESHDVVWFDFNVICNSPRSQLDYLEIAQRYKTVFVSHIPIFSPHDMIQVLLFIHFIDVMYDNRIKVILSATTGIDELYPEGKLHTSFIRTRSRLQEMQSADYLNR